MGPTWYAPGGLLLVTFSFIIFSICNCLFLIFHIFLPFLLFFLSCMCFLYVFHCFFPCQVPDWYFCWLLPFTDFFWFLGSVINSIAYICLTSLTRAKPKEKNEICRSISTHAVKCDGVFFVLQHGFQYGFQHA